MTGQQPELWPCPRCQTPIPPTSTVCPNCGFALTQQVQDQQTTAVAAPPVKRGWSTKKKVVIGVIAVFAVLVVASALAGPRRPATAPAPATYQAEYGGSADVYAEIAASRDCAALQETFDRAAGNNESAQAGTPEHRWTLGYMTAADERMKSIGCY